MGVFLNGRDIPGLDTRGERVSGDSFLILLNAGPEAVAFTLPKGNWGESWTKMVDTWDGAVLDGGGSPLTGGEELEVGAHASVLLRRVD